MASCPNILKPSAILYHYPCPDGAFAALAAHLYFSATSSPVLFFPNTVYSPITPDLLPLPNIADLYLLDFIGPSSFIPQISPKVDRVLVLDHHKTALETLNPKNPAEKNLTTVIDMARSGATIAYDYFKQKLITDSGRRYEAAIAEFDRLREIFEYIEDGDLWKWRLPNSKAFYNGLKDCKIEFDCNINPNLFDQLRSLDLQSVIEKGIASSSEKQRIIDEALLESFEIGIGGRGGAVRCLAARADKIPELRSDLGHQLACKGSEMGLMRMGAVVYKVEGIDGRVKVSLRGDGEVDTAVISAGFGGGGHRNASSFMVSADEFDRWKLES